MSNSTGDPVNKSGFLSSLKKSFGTLFTPSTPAPVEPSIISAANSSTPASVFSTGSNPVPSNVGSNPVPSNVGSNPVPSTSTPVESGRFMMGGGEKAMLNSIIRSLKKNNRNSERNNDRNKKDSKNGGSKGKKDSKKRKTRKGSK